MQVLQVRELEAITVVELFMQLESQLVIEQLTERLATKLVVLNVERLTKQPMMQLTKLTK